MLRFPASVVLLIVMLLAGYSGANFNQQTTQDTDAGVVEPYIAKGRVMDSGGNPLPGVEMFLSYTLGHNANMLTTSNADGSYRYDLTGYPAGSTWHVGAKLEREFNGDTFEFTLYPDDNSSFAAASGANRDLIWHLSGKTPEGSVYGGTVYVYTALNTPYLDMDLVEVTLTPVELIDGTAGETISGPLDYGMEFKDIPVGTYQATATYRPDGGPGYQLLISVRNQDSYAASATGSFFANSP